MSKQVMILFGILVSIAATYPNRAWAPGAGGSVRPPAPTYICTIRVYNLIDGGIDRADDPFFSALLPTLKWVYSVDSVDSWEKCFDKAIALSHRFHYLWDDTDVITYGPETLHIYFLWWYDSNTEAEMHDPWGYVNKHTSFWDSGERSKGNRIFDKWGILQDDK